MFKVRGVHGSVWVGFVPNPQLTQWHLVFNEKTRHRSQKPIGQVRSDRIGLIDGRIERRCFRRFLLGDDLYFSSDLRWICAKLTRSEKKIIKLSSNLCQTHEIWAKKIKSLDLCKTHEIWAKKHEIVTGLSKTHWSFAGFEQNPTYFHWIWALVEQNPLYCSWI